MKKGFSREEMMRSARSAGDNKAPRLGVRVGVSGTGSSLGRGPE